MPGKELLSSMVTTGTLLVSLLGVGLTAAVKPGSVLTVTGGNFACDPDPESGVCQTPSEVTPPGVRAPLGPSLVEDA